MVTLWWRVVSPRRCLLLPVSHVACVHLERAAMAMDDLRLGPYSYTRGSGVAGLAYTAMPPCWKASASCGHPLVAFGVGSEVPSLACVSHCTCPPRASSHGHGRLTFGSLLLYPWLSGCRAGVHTHTTEPEALSQSWESRGGLTYRLTGAISWVSLDTAVHV